MIPFQTWLSQILGYCRLVMDTAEIQRAWIDDDFIHTSVTNFDELYEQIFDDLDSDTFERELGSHLANDELARVALSGFLDAIRNADNARERNIELASPDKLLISDEWRRVVDAAKGVMVLFEGSDVGQRGSMV